MKTWRVVLAAGAAFIIVASHVAAVEPELHVRSGLPALATLADNPAAGGEFRVAYLGGSITAAVGWRALTTEHLRALYPKVKVVEIAAGLPGTGSNLGACRVGNDVLRHHPDLLFIEFAVNDTGVPPDRIQRTIEGIVRQTLRANPRTDICFIYTVSTPNLPALQAGEFPPPARAMETVAEYYGIPSLHLGVEVAQRLVAGTLVFKNPSAPDATTTFSVDGVHPTTSGHRIYIEEIARSLPLMLRATASIARVLPPPLHPDNWEHASILPIDSTQRDGEWIKVPLDDPNLRGVTKALLPPTWRTAADGASIAFEFRGKSFGLLGIAAPDSGEFRVTVDDLAPVTTTFFDAYASPTFCRQREWFFPTALPDMLHHVRVERLATALPKAAIKAKAGKPMDDPLPYAAHTLTLCGVLVVGSPSP